MENQHVRSAEVVQNPVKDHMLGFLLGCIHRVIQSHFSPKQTLPYNQDTLEGHIVFISVVRCPLRVQSNDGDVSSFLKLPHFFLGRIGWGVAEYGNSTREIKAVIWISLDYPAKVFHCGIPPQRCPRPVEVEMTIKTVRKTCRPTPG